MVDDPEDEWIHPFIRKCEKQVLNESGLKYRFEKSFDLINDTQLLKSGVEISAVTEVEGDQIRNQIRNRIVLSRGNKTSAVDCIHTVVGQFRLNPESENGIEIISREVQPITGSTLSPEEHYVALKSFVGYLIEKGILNCLVKSFEHEFRYIEQHPEFSHFIRQQFTEALVEIAPDVTFNLLPFVLESLGTEDPERLRLTLGNYLIPIIKILQEKAQDHWDIATKHYLKENLQSTRIFLEKCKKLKKLGFEIKAIFYEILLNTRSYFRRLGRIHNPKVVKENMEKIKRIMAFLQAGPDILGYSDEWEDAQESPVSMTSIIHADSLSQEKQENALESILTVTQGEIERGLKRLEKETRHLRFHKK